MLYKTATDNYVENKLCIKHLVVLYAYPGVSFA